MAKRTDALDRVHTDVQAALAADDRPVVGVVWVDPATDTGVSGIAVYPLFPSASVAPGFHYHGGALTQPTFRWLGDAVADVCGQGQRCLFAAEQDAFRGVARGLGISIGAVQGFLVDVNAISAGQRIDVQSNVWRAGAKIRAAGRAAKKAAAVKLSGIADHNAAEAWLAARWLAGVVSTEQARVRS